MKLFHILLLGLIVVTSSSCYEKEDGCLDAEAVNFDVTADENCCCSYPKMVLTMSHAYEDSGLSFGTNYLNNINSPFQVLSVQYYLSGFSLVDNSNNSFVTTSTVSLPQLTGGNIETADDFVLINRGVFANVDSIGFFPTYGIFEKLQFEIGVKEVAKNTDPEKVDESFPLATQTDSMWYNNGQYVAAKIMLKPDTVEISDTITINIFENSLVSLDSQLELSRATHLNLQLQVDYAVWFNGIDFQNDSQQSIMNQIQSNLASSLSFY